MFVKMKLVLLIFVVYVEVRNASGAQDQHYPINSQNPLIHFNRIEHFDKQQQHRVGHSNNQQHPASHYDNQQQPPADKQSLDIPKVDGKTDLEDSIDQQH
eukprot:1097143_1